MTRRDVLIALSAIFLGIAAKAVEFIALPVSYRPDLLVVLAVSVGWACGFWTSVPAGFALGLVEDLITGRALGSRAISLSIAAATSSLLKRFISPEAVLSKAIAALVASSVADAATFGLLRAMGIEVGFMHFAQMIWPSTVAWSVVLILPLDSVNRRFALLLGRFWPAPEGREAAA